MQIQRDSTACHSAERIAKPARTQSVPAKALVLLSAIAMFAASGYLVGIGVSQRKIGHLEAHQRTLTEEVSTLNARLSKVERVPPQVRIDNQVDQLTTRDGAKPTKVTASERETPLSVLERIERMPTRPLNETPEQRADRLLAERGRGDAARRRSSLRRESALSERPQPSIEELEAMATGRARKGFSGSLPRDGRDPTPRRSRPGAYITGGKEWIAENHDGSVIELSDGSRWLISPVDRVETSLWLTTDDILVKDGDGGEYGYRLIHLDDGEAVDAKYLGTD